MALEDDIARIFRENVDRTPPGADRDSQFSGLERRLPRLRGIPGIYVEDENTAVFILETDNGEKIHVPVDGHSLPLMADLIRYVLQVAPSAQPDEDLTTALIPSFSPFE